MKIILRLTFTLCVFCLLCGAARAQNIGFSAGGIVNETSFAKSYSWKLNYYDTISGNWKWSFSWYNEGHFTRHHRDGMLLQAGYNLPVVEDKFFADILAGPYYFFDTTPGKGSDYKNIHSLGLGTSLGFWYYFTPEWALRGSFTSILSDGANIDMASFLLGLSYKLKPAARVDIHPIYDGQNEVVIYSGQTIVNSFNSQHGMSAMIEYRRNMYEYLDISAAFLNEGDSNVIRRNGIILQAWPVKRFYEGSLALSVGLGAYIALDSHEVNDGRKNKPAAGIITMSGAYRVGIVPITLRAAWNRIATSYDRDTDVIMAGIGYYF